MEKYRVLTYDIDLGKFTPQKGVRQLAYGLGGLKRALRKLQSMGYPCNRSGDDSDPSVLIERFELRANTTSKTAEK
jgi:hypothetical protein